MFINFSNHPSKKWGEQQLREAQRFGEVKDLPFPNVQPEWSSEEVNRLADEYAEILTKMGGENCTVHIMGEMTFTHAVVSRLKEQGIVCVASTTKRCAYETADGKKVSTFRFVQFRRY